MKTIIRSSKSVKYISLNNDTIYIHESNVDDIHEDNKCIICRRYKNENMILKTLNLINKCLEDKINHYEDDIIISMELNSNTRDMIKFTKEKEIDDTIIDILSFVKCIYCVKDNIDVMRSDLNDITSILELLSEFKTYVATSPQLRLFIR